MTATIEIDYSVLAWMVIALFGLVGYRRGWWKEGLTTGFLTLLIVLLKLPGLAEHIVNTINKSLKLLYLVIVTRSLDIERIAKVAKEIGEIPIKIDPTDPRVYITALIGVLPISYIYGKIMGGKLVPDPTGALLGAILGLLNGFTIISLLREYMVGRYLPGAAVTPEVPTSIVVTVKNTPTPDVMEGWVPWLIVSFGAVFLGFVMVAPLRLQRKRIPILGWSVTIPWPGEVQHYVSALNQRLAAEQWATLSKTAANLAHRINNTAGLIPIVTQDLKELLADVALEGGQRQEIDAGLQRIERNTRFTLQMADALSKPFAFEALPAEEFDVNALLEESISVADIAEDVTLTTKYADELPKVITSRLLADVFVEFITNAVKAMPDGGQLEIGSRLGKEGWVEVWFSDTGHGIPPESQGKIFDLFFTTSEDSLGLGLWWVKTFLVQQGAIIDVESEVGEGTTFTVRLPVKGHRAAVG